MSKFLSFVVGVMLSAAVVMTAVMFLSEWVREQGSLAHDWLPSATMLPLPRPARHDTPPILQGKQKLKDRVLADLIDRKIPLLHAAVLLRHFEANPGSARPFVPGDPDTESRCLEVIRLAREKLNEQHPDKVDELMAPLEEQFRLYKEHAPKMPPRLTSVAVHHDTP